MSTQKIKRMLLIQPTIYDQYNKLVKKNMLYFIGLTMPLLAAECGDDWDVQICIETIEDIPWDTDIDLIGIGSMGHSIIRGIEIAKEFKMSLCKITRGSKELKKEDSAFRKILDMVKK